MSGSGRLRIVLCALAAALLWPGRAVAAAGGAPLTIAEPAGVDRAGEPVTTGVPVPRGALVDANDVRLVRAGREVPAQFRATGLWRPGRSVRWLLVDLQADVKASEIQVYALEYGPGVSRRASPPAAIRIDEADDAFTVRTGAATFRISRKTFSLFDEVRLAGGHAIVARPPAGGDGRGAFVGGLQRMVTRPIPAATNTGRSRLIYATCTPRAPRADCTLRFISDTEYELTTDGARPLGRGAYLKDFTSNDGAVSIPNDAWLRYARPKAGDVYTFRLLPAGTAVAAEGLYDSAVVERGPLRSVIRVKGSFGPAGAPALEYTAWYHFHAGSARVSLAFTLENNADGGRTSTGNARNADIGGVNCVFFDEIALRLPLATGGWNSFQTGNGEDDLLAGPLEAMEIYQDSSGGAHWDRYRKAAFHPRPSSYVTFRGYELTHGGRVCGRGERALGWLDVSGSEAGLTVAVRDFWQNYPKALAADQHGCVEVRLFPGRYAGDFAFRSGEHKTHEVLLDFHAGRREAPTSLAIARGYSEPLRLFASPRHYAESGALGRLHPYDPQRFAAYEARNLSAIGVYPPGAQAGPSILSRREEFELHGWMDYGDVSMDFEAPSGQWGMKYDLDYQMLRQFARTGRREWWTLFVAADRHTRDIDIHHQPHYPWPHLVKGGVWAHSLHSEPGHRNPHRNHNHFTKDLCFGARGTAALYYLTGDWKAREACLEIAANALAEYMSPQSDPGPPAANNRMGWRGDACTLNRLLEGYLLTGEESFLRHARRQVASCAFDGRQKDHKPTSLWSSVFYMMALARYVEMFPDDRAARSYLLAHIETLRRSVDPANGIHYTVTPLPDGSIAGKGTCSHYNIMAADALTVGFMLTGEAKYLAAARLCFAYGVRNACWKDGPATYMQIHSANGATHGNVFMSVEAASLTKRPAAAPR